MKFFVLVATLAFCYAVSATEVEQTKPEEVESMQMQHRSNEPSTGFQDTNARVQTNKQHITAQPIYSTNPAAHQQAVYQHVASPAPQYQQAQAPQYQQAAAPQYQQAQQTPQYQQAQAPQYQQPQAPAAGGAYHQVYQNQQPDGGVLQGQAVVYNHPKETAIVKKPLPEKPSYYPKQSSYSAVPQQPNRRNGGSPINPGARFVADPKRSHLIEEMSDTQLQQLTYPQPYQGAVPQYTNFVNPPHNVHSPYTQHYNPELVTYEQTEHGFMDRVWGEVEVMRQSMRTDFFGAIPTFFRNVWDALVGAMSSASARMLDFDWFTIFDIVRKQIA